MTPTADDKPEAHANAPFAAWELQNDPYTIEGELEGFARFATGVRTTRRPVLRVVGLLIVAAMLGPMVFAVASMLWRATIG